MSILLLNANALHIPLATGSVNCCVTSPPYYGLRDYGTSNWEGGDLECDHLAPPRGGRGDASTKQVTSKGTQEYQYASICGKCGAARIDNQIGLEETPLAYVEKLVQVFREVNRVLTDDGTLWLNLGDSYAGSGGVGNQRDDANKGNMPHFKNPNSYAITRSKRIERGSSRWGGGNIPAGRGLKPKDLIGIPWMVAFALRADGWYLRSEIIWNKTNPMPESVKDRPSRSHEQIFLLTKSRRYWYDFEAVLEPATSSIDQLQSHHDPSNPKYQAVPERWKDQFNGRVWGNIGSRNKRSVWNTATNPYAGAHFATYPPELIEPCIKAGCPVGGVVLDPFSGSGTTAMVSRKLSRRAVGLDLSLAYIRECAWPRLQLNALDEFQNGKKASGDYSDLPLFLDA